MSLLTYSGSLVFVGRLIILVDGDNDDDDDIYDDTMIEPSISERESIFKENILDGVLRMLQFSEKIYKKILDPIFFT